jgi:hypothetical protein
MERGLGLGTAKTSYRKIETLIPRNETGGLSPNSYVHASVSDLYIPTVGLPILLQVNRCTDPGNILQ